MGIGGAVISDNYRSLRHGCLHVGTAVLVMRLHKSLGAAPCSMSSDDVLEVAHNTTLERGTATFMLTITPPF